MRHRPHPRQRLLDWRFLVALCALLVLGTVVTSYVTTVADNHAKARRLDAALAQLRSTDDEARRGRVAADHQRDRLLANQRALLRQLHRLETTDAALRRYLDQLGVSVPADLTSPAGQRGAVRTQQAPRPRTAAGKDRPRGSGAVPPASPAGGTQHRPPTQPPTTPTSPPSGGLDGLVGELRGLLP